MLCLTRDQLRRELLTSYFAKIGILTTSEEIVTICRRIIHNLQMKNEIGGTIMKKFMLFNQDNEPVSEIYWGEFTCSILELAGVYVVHVATVIHKDTYNFAVAVYRDVTEAAQAVADLKDFALNVNKENQGYAMPVSEEPVSALEIVDAIA